MMRTIRLAAAGSALAATGFLTLLAASANAAPTPAQRCAAAKLLAAGAEARSALSCVQRSLATGAHDACVANAAARRDASFAAAESRGGCATTGDSAAVGSEVEALLDATLTALRPGGPAASGCTSAQLKAASVAIAKLAQAYARDERYPDPVRLGATVSATLGKLVGAFARAASRGDCLSTTNGVEAGTIVRTAAERLRGTILPFCGDGVRAGAEVCDGAEHGSCLAGCDLDCTCSPPACGNAVVEPGEECDTGACPGTEPGEYGCFSQFTSNPCQCCAQEGPCYVRGFGSIDPVETPCCAGTCNIPGPDAGPDVMVFCEMPPAECPCWTSASLDATFSAGYFDQNGRGGADCDDPQVTGIAAVDTCFLVQPVGGGRDLTRAGAAVLGNSSCTVFADLDPSDSGFCNGPPTLIGITAAEAAACVAELQASQIYQSSCP